MEGLNRRIIEGTCGALLQANAPYYFWLHAAAHWAKTCAFARKNRQGITPYEALRGQPAPAWRGVPFGCLVLYRAPRTSEIELGRLKFEARGRQGIIIGYSDARSYVVLDEPELLEKGI